MVARRSGFGLISRRWSKILPALFASLTLLIISVVTSVMANPDQKNQENQNSNKSQKQQRIQVNQRSKKSASQLNPRYGSRHRAASHTGASKHPALVGTTYIKRSGKRQQLVETTVKDRHGRKHKIVEEITIDRHGHKHYRQLAQTTTAGVKNNAGAIVHPSKTTAYSRAQNQASPGEEPVTKAQTKPPGEEEQKESTEPPHEYTNYGKAYSLFDEGTNARLSGNYQLAIASLSKALDLVPDNAHGGPSVLTLNMEYELAQAAESSGDYALAARYYARAVTDRPNFVDASVRLVQCLARCGKSTEALSAARDAVEHNPNDPRAQADPFDHVGKKWF